MRELRLLPQSSASQRLMFSMLATVRTHPVAVEEHNGATYEGLESGHWPSQRCCQSVTCRTIFWSVALAVTQHGECFYLSHCFLFLIKLSSVWRCLCPAQLPDPGDGATITSGTPAFGEFCLMGLTVVLHSLLPPRQWGLSAGLGLVCAMTRST